MAAPHAHAPLPAPTPALTSLADDCARSVLAEFAGKKLLPEQLAISIIDLGAPDALRCGSFRGTAPIYPASVIKLFFLAAAHQWMEDGRLADSPELRRAMRDMIVDSSNDATAYIVDLLTGTTSGPELSDTEIASWWERRNAVNRYFASLGYTDINASKKPWGDGPYGRETQAIQRFSPKRNSLTTDATARLLATIATGRCVSEKRSAEMMELLSRDPAGADKGDRQARFTGAALPSGSKLWSKAGWTSQTRHDAAVIQLPNQSRRFVLVVFTTDHANETGIIHSVVRKVCEGWQKTPRP